MRMFPFYYRHNSFLPLSTGLLPTSLFVLTPQVCTFRVSRETSEGQCVLVNHIGMSVQEQAAFHACCAFCVRGSEADVDSTVLVLVRGALTLNFSIPGRCKVPPSGYCTTMWSLRVGV